METNFMELHDLFKKVEYLYRERVKGILGPLKLSNLEFRYLKNIEEDERPTISEISQRLSKHNSNITGLLDSLEKKGYIRRTMDTVDRRIIRIEYTQEGLSKREEALKIFENKVSLFYKMCLLGFGTVLSSLRYFAEKLDEGKINMEEKRMRSGNTNVWCQGQRMKKSKWVRDFEQSNEKLVVKFIQANKIRYLFGLIVFAGVNALEILTPLTAKSSTNCMSGYGLKFD